MKFEIENAIEILQNTPDTLKALMADLSDEWTLEANGDDVWCAYDIIGHYIHGEKTDWIPRARVILAQGKNVTFEPFDRFAQFENSRGKSLQELLDEFAQIRIDNINALRELKINDEQLGLTGIHPELGEVTLEQLLATWVVHDLTHIRQITIEFAKKYAENVGVWKQYLSILD
ncbi:MAG: DinB family protein [Pyrinomonadaceae bacterium]|nr:DinB family protein [Pyrinomonadaceae bacterium]